MIRLPQALADLLHWAQVEAPLPLAVVGMAVSLILGMGIVTAWKLKRDAKRKVPEYTPEFPYLPRRASKEEVEAVKGMLRQNGVKVVEEAP